MSFKAIFGAALVATLLTLWTAGQPQAGPVPGWGLSGSKPADYEIGVNPTGGQSRNPAAFLKAKTDKVEGFGTLAQMVDAEAYRGKRVRFSAAVRTEDISGWAGLWLRADVDGRTAVLDNMKDRAIKGTTGWQRYEVVLDVPADASAVAFGLLAGDGGGVAWLDDVRLEVVPDSVPVTAKKRPGPPKLPQNIDFRG